MSAVTHRLATGETVTLPLEAAGAAVGAAVPAPLARLRSVLPDALVPVPVSPGRGVVVLAGVRYDEVGPLVPYREFAVGVPALPASAQTAAAPSRWATCGRSPSTAQPSTSGPAAGGPLARAVRELGVRGSDDRSAGPAGEPAPSRRLALARFHGRFGARFHPARPIG